MSRNKGKRGEREIVDLLQPICDELCREVGSKRINLQRNTIQSDEGGSDIVGLDWLGLEVKWVEQQNPANLDGWWEQTVLQVHQHPNVYGQARTPVLLYRKNGHNWRARLMGWAGGHNGPGVACLVDVDQAGFVGWFIARLRHELHQRARR